jgi:hypothetical protein
MIVALSPITLFIGYHLYCHDFGFWIGWMGFIDTLYTQFVTTIICNAIAISTLHGSLLHTLVSSVFASRILATDS